MVNPPPLYMNKGLSRKIIFYLKNLRLNYFVLYLLSLHNVDQEQRYEEGQKDCPKDPYHDISKRHGLSGDGRGY